MSRFKPAARGYRRPMAGWWRKNPFYLRYMLREGTAVLLTVYAIILLQGLDALDDGADAWAAWRASLAAPWSIVLHLLIFAAVTYHSITWFAVLPKTAPKLPIEPRLVSRAFQLAAAGASLVVLVVVWWTAL